VQTTRITRFDLSALSDSFGVSATRSLKETVVGDARRDIRSTDLHAAVERFSAISRTPEGRRAVIYLLPAAWR
jgi:hypothetical protein